MGPETAVRIAGPADVVVLARLIVGFRDFLGSTDPGATEIEATVSVLIKDPATEFILVGEPESGFGQIRFRLSLWTGAEDAWIEDVFVDESARGRGYGRLLLEAIISRARARGCARVQLDANRKNEAAIKLYESLGFATSHNYVKWGDSPDLFYTLNLDE